MKRTSALTSSLIAGATAAAITLCVVSSAYAMYSFWNEGKWPAKSWPKQLEPLRKQARTYEGPETAHRHYAIPFTKREEFEAAWPHLLKVKTKGAPILLVRESFFLGKGTGEDSSKNGSKSVKAAAAAVAGVIVHTPPVGQSRNPATPEAPINSTNVRERWMNTTYIEVVVPDSGSSSGIIDLDRVPLPKDTPVIDERFSRRSPGS